MSTWCSTYANLFCSNEASFFEIERRRVPAEIDMYFGELVMRQAPDLSEIVVAVCVGQDARDAGGKRAQDCRADVPAIFEFAELLSSHLLVDIVQRFSLKKKVRLLGSKMPPLVKYSLETHCKYGVSLNFNFGSANLLYKYLVIGDKLARFACFCTGMD
jgi:hypothetical protein